ncbi:SpoIIE family protein phosphatase [Streptomyces sp. b94]|uniref:SpoIIE family protein phosphatase n=1 Tax=Streptomyces sp. b94 TaxID=1827634 RepID=UPI001B362A79|nr:SpoIIE family protein phosphatase [Streptomyces sp. b94]MBQ1098284.1 SpoIIE family protein phosphatase [Streptomyces sp. b94]
MGDLKGAEASSRRLPRRPQSVAEARRFVRAAADGVAPVLVDTVELLVSELVTNALLHARTDIDVSARVEDGTVHVRVRDQRPDRKLLPQECPAYTGTGQGLAIVGRLASRCGVETDEASKTVWFELGPDGTPPQVTDWGSAEPPDSGAHVTLIDMPGALYVASQQQRHTLLFETMLAAAAGFDLGVPPRDLTTAQDVSNVISARVTAALRREPAGQKAPSLSVRLPADAGPAVETLRRVLGLAEEAARDEHLLTLPALPRNGVFQQWLFDQIVGQLAGGPATAWTMVPREPGASPVELVPWDAAQVRSSRVPTIAADERNRIIAANGPAADMLGWQPDDLVGQPLTALIPEHLRKRHLTAFTSLLLSGQPRILGRSVPLPALHRDGGVVPVRLFIQTQETTDGHTVFVAQLTPRASAPPASAKSPPGRSRSAAVDPRSAPSDLPGGEAVADSAPDGAAAGAPGNGPDHVGPSALERLSLLVATSAAMSNTPGTEEGLRGAGRVMTERLADWCAVDLFREDAQAERICVVHRTFQDLGPERHEGLLPPVTDAARGPLARVLRGAGPLLLTGAPPPGQSASPLDAHYLDLLGHLRARSAIVAPLRARRQVIGALTVARGDGWQPFTEEDLPLVDELCRVLALGVDNARLYQETRNIAERLQRSLLPALPNIEHLQMAARYAASSTTAQVGGDWYDCFVVPNGETALVIGDVTGHDLDAAVAMSQLRSMLRGIAVDRQEPPETVLRRLDLANQTLHREATATCIYGLVRGGTDGPWELVHSSAGHLPPLLTAPDGRTRYLDAGSGLLLGMDPDVPRPSATDEIPPDSTLLLYTDGLIERRGESLDAAMERLRRRASELAREPLDVFCDELLIGLGADNDDDIAVLAVRPAPPAASG